MIGLGEPREVRAASRRTYSKSWLHPFGSPADMRDDGQAAGAAVLTYRFWKDTLKPIRCPRQEHPSRHSVATIVGVLEPSVPYPLKPKSSPTCHQPASSFGTMVTAAFIA